MTATTPACRCRLSRRQQVIVVLGMWALAIISSGSGLEAAVHPLTLFSALVATVLVVLTTGS
ncbi:MAG TPA: hypothetical protein VFL61_14890 [Gaiellaceae bacterium]|nr:hypothetical protein [Gaiellaceae bacterium]